MARHLVGVPHRRAGAGGDAARSPRHHRRLEPHVGRPAQHCGRVDVGPVDEHLEVQVAAGRQARRTGQADLLALLDALAHRDPEHGQVRRPGHHPALVEGAVVDLHQEAVAAGHGGAGDDAVGHRDDRGAAGGGHVRAVVRAHVVEDRVEARSERRGDRPRHGRHEPRLHRQGGDRVRRQAGDERDVQVRGRDEGALRGDAAGGHLLGDGAEGRRGRGEAVAPRGALSRPEGAGGRAELVGRDGVGRHGDGRGGLERKGGGTGERHGEAGRERHRGEQPPAAAAGPRSVRRGGAVCAVHQDFPRVGREGKGPGGASGCSEL